MRPQLLHDCGSEGFHYNQVDDGNHALILSSMRGLERCPDKTVTQFYNHHIFHALVTLIFSLCRMHGMRRKAQCIMPKSLLPGGWKLYCLPSPPLPLLCFFLKRVQQKAGDEAPVISQSLFTWFTECELKGYSDVICSDLDENILR